MVTEASPLVPRRSRFPAVRLWRRATLIGVGVAIAVLLATKSFPSEESRVNDTVPVANDDAFFCGIQGYETGYMKLANKKDDQYFYWYVPSSSADPDKDPLMLWLTGGPGVPSTVALLAENGPCLVQSDGKTMKRNPYGWNSQANVIWLDQPTNVGFSYGANEDADSTEANVGENIYWFLQGFLDKYPKLQNREFFIAGESYGGHYVPAAAHFIMDQQTKQVSKSTSSLHSINLQGIAIGNGLIDAAIQFPRYIDMAENAYNVTFVNASQLEEMKPLAVECGKRIRACQADVSLCEDAGVFCVSHLDQPFTSGSQRNPFDIRKVCEAADAQTCNSMDHIGVFLNREDVRSKIGVDTTKAGVWTLVEDKVASAFTGSGDDMASYSGYVADLLNEGIRVLVYTGDADLACNWHGGLAWTKAMEWKGRADFNAAKVQHYTTDKGVDAGVFQSAGNLLTFLRVFNSGHMLPQDQPEVALDMINKFLKNKRL